MKTQIVNPASVSIRNPKSASKNDNSFWTSYFKYYDVLLKVLPYKKLMKALAAGLEVADNDLVLDAGSGTGNINYYVNRNCKMFAVDSSREALDRLSNKFPEVEVVKTSLTKALPFESNSFDKLVSNNVLYTIALEKWPVIISEFRRVLKPGGKLVIANPTIGFSPIRIYLKHIVQSLKERGFFTTVKEMVVLAPDTIKMLSFNKIITNKEVIEKYHFVGESEQVKLFSAAGFRQLKETQVVYGSQAILDVFHIEK